MPDPRPGRGRLLLACLALTLTPQGGSPPIRLSARPVLDIGGGTGDSLSEFTQITGLFSLSNGDIAVASFVQPPFIRIFQRNGLVRATGGRTGGGPGEYRAALWIRPMKSDSILVYDPAQARFSVLSGDGRLGRSITIVGPAAGMRTYVFGRFEDGSLISRPNSMIPPEASGHGRAMVPLLRLSETGGLIDTLGHFPDAEYFTEGPAVIARTPQEFRAQPQRSLVPFGLVSVFLSGDRSFFVGTGDSFEITEYDFKGVPVRTFTRPGQRRPVRPDDLAALKAERLSQARRREDSTRIEEEWSKVKPASLMPAYDRPALRDRLHCLWVKEFQPPQDPSSSWSVFRPDGSFLGTAILPKGFRPYEIGKDYILGTTKDDDDFVHIKIYGLTRSS